MWNKLNPSFAGCVRINHTYVLTEYFEILMSAFVGFIGNPVMKVWLYPLRVPKEDNFVGLRSLCGPIQHVQTVNPFLSGNP